MPVYLKFHKVGSSTVAEALRDRIGQKPVWWRQKARETWPQCAEPFAHAALQLYRVAGREGILAHCLDETVVAKCQEEDLVITAVLREPLEKTVSQFYFFHGGYENAFKDIPDTALSPMQRAAKAAVAKLKNDTLTITPHEMESFLQFIKNHSFDSGDNYESMGNAVDDLPPNNWVFECEPVLGRFVHERKKDGNVPFVSTADSLKAARHNLRTDMDAVGTTELMGSYWTLLSAVTNMSYPSSCLKNNDHGAKTMNKHLFGSEHRPPPRELFVPEVVEVMRRELANEIVVYEDAERVHRIQLERATGLTVQQATEQWKSYCLVEGDAARAARKAHDTAQSAEIQRQKQLRLQKEEQDKSAPAAE
jgi:hypothetical protein